MERQFAEALVQTYGTITAMQVVNAMVLNAMPIPVNQGMIAGVAAVVWFGQNTLPFADMLPTGTARIAFLAGAVALIPQIHQAIARPPLADITNR